MRVHTKTPPSSLPPGLARGDMIDVDFRLDGRQWVLTVMFVGYTAVTRSLPATVGADGLLVIDEKTLRSPHADDQMACVFQAPSLTTSDPRRPLRPGTRTIFWMRDVVSVRRSEWTGALVSPDTAENVFERNRAWKAAGHQT